MRVRYHSLHSEHPVTYLKRNGEWIIPGSDYDDDIPEYLRISDYYARGYKWMAERAELDRRTREGMRGRRDSSGQIHKVWEKEEILFLTEHYVKDRTLTMPEIAERLGRTVLSVQARIKKLRRKIA